MKYAHLLRIGLYTIGVFGIVFRSVDKTYLYVFNKPLFIHFYFKKKKLTNLQKDILEKENSFYGNLSDLDKSYFEHRLVRFIERYDLIGRDGYAVTDYCRVMVGSIYIMMTFGMRTYLTRVFSKIIIYPNAFMSTTNKRMHKGEFNPKHKVVVFSWNDFLKGVDIKNDNLHLGIHEFAHVLTVHAEQSNDSGASIFSDGMGELADYLSIEKNRAHIRNLGYIRVYAFTNSFEFIAVLLEYFFESPEVFKRILPDVYQIIRRMLNFKYDQGLSIKESSL